MKLTFFVSLVFLLTETGELHKGKLLVVVTLRCNFSDVFLLYHHSETSSGSDYHEL